MIPAEAVEAAALAFYRNDQYNQVTDWPSVEELAKGRSIFDPPPTLEQFKADYIRDASAILEAAAPILMAKAWDEGYLACVDDIFRDSELGKTGQRLEDGQQNPYRAAAERGGE